MDKDGRAPTEAQYWLAFYGLLSGFASVLAGLAAPQIATLAASIIVAGCNLLCAYGGVIGARIVATVLGGLTDTACNAIAWGVVLIFAAEAVALGCLCLFDDPSQPEFAQGDAV